jgi:hypothetical protein
LTKVLFLKQEKAVRKWNTLLALLFILGGICHPTTAVAQGGGVTMDARAGLDGFYKIDDWLVVQVVIANEGPDIEGEIQLQVTDNWDGEVLYTQQAILPTHSRKQFTLYAFVKNYTRDLTVKLMQRNKLIAEARVAIEPLNAQDFLCGVVSHDVSALNYLAGLAPIGQGRVHVAHLALSDLPGQGRTLGAIDALILHNVDSSLLTPAQRDALRGWVAFGGHLIIVGGPNAMATAAGLKDLLPVRITGSQTTTDIGTLGDFANAPFSPNVPAVVAVVEPIDSGKPANTRVLAGTSELPLLVRRQVDRGRIDYLALDPDLEPVRTWIGNDALWPRIFFSAPLALRPGHAKINWGSWNPALSNIPSLDLPPVLLVMAFLFFYIVIVGPLNLLILKLLDKRALAWITMPVLILLFSCAAYIIGSVSRGRKVIVSQVTVIRAQPESSIAAIDTFAGLYSPRRKSYAVRLPDNVLVRQLASSYNPGSMSGETIKVEQGPPTFLRDLEINVGEMRGAAMHDIRAWQSIEADLILSQPRSTIYHIEGTITNRSGTTIRDGALVINSQAIEIGELKDGETKRISTDLTQKPSSTSQLITQLIGPYATGNERRERERRRQTLNNILSPAYYRGSGPTVSSVQLDGLTLFGWLDKSPDAIEIERTSTSVAATTLLIASLPLSTSNENEVIVPKGFMGWHVIDGEPNATPREIYSYQPEATFRFRIPDAQTTLVEKMFLHVDALDSTPYGSPPIVYIKDTTTDQWQSLGNLAWGENELGDPQRFVRSDGGIDLRVSPETIQAPVSVDLTIKGAIK